MRSPKGTSPNPNSRYSSLSSSSSSSSNNSSSLALTTTTPVTATTTTSNSQQQQQQQTSGVTLTDSESTPTTFLVDVSALSGLLCELSCTECQSNNLTIKKIGQRGHIGIIDIQCPSCNNTIQWHTADSDMNK